LLTHSLEINKKLGIERVRMSTSDFGQTVETAVSRISALRR